MGMENRRSVNLSTERLVMTAMLTALTAVLAYFGGFIKIGSLASVNLTLIPVVLGGALLGPFVSAWLGFVSGALGRKKTILLGITLMTVCYFIAIFIKQQTPIMYAIFGLVGIGWAAINVNSFPMVVEMSTGSDVGKYTGFYYTFSMAAQITTPLLSGLLIDKLGIGYTILFPYAVLFSALSFVTMLFVKHGDTKPQKKASALESFADVD